MSVVELVEVQWFLSNLVESRDYERMRMSIRMRMRTIDGRIRLLVERVVVEDIYNWDLLIGSMNEPCVRSGE